MEKHKRIAIHYPKLQEIVTNSGFTLIEAANALKELDRLVCPAHILRTNEQYSNDKATLAKLIVTMDQLDLLKDLELFELAHSCPRQLDQYDMCLGRLRKLALGTELCMRSLAAICKVHAVIRQLSTETSALYQGLS